MDYKAALAIGRGPDLHRIEKLDAAFDELVRVRDEAQEALHAIQEDRMRRTAEEVKRLRAEIAAKA